MSSHNRFRIHGSQRGTCHQVSSGPLPQAKSLQCDVKPIDLKTRMAAARRAAARTYMNTASFRRCQPELMKQM